MEPKQDPNAPEAPSVDAARSRFLDSMGLGEASLKDLTAEGGDTEQVALSSLPEDFEVPGASGKDTVVPRVAGVQIRPMNDAAPVADPVPTGSDSDDEAKAEGDSWEMPTVASLDAGESVEETAEAVEAEEDGFPAESVEAEEERLEAEESNSAPEAAETLFLTCPKCEGELVLHREHVGVEGACVWCNTKIVAAESGMDGEVRVFAVFQPDFLRDQEETFEEQPQEPIEQDEAPARKETPEQSGETIEEEPVRETMPEVEEPEPFPAAGFSTDPQPALEEMPPAPMPDLPDGFAETAPAFPEAEEAPAAIEEPTELPSSGFEMPSDGFASTSAPSISDGPGGTFPGPDTEEASAMETNPAPTPVEGMPFPNALEPLPSGFGAESVEEPPAESAPTTEPAGFGDFLQEEAPSEDSAPASAGFESFSEEAEADAEPQPSSGFGEVLSKAASWSGDVQPEAAPESEAPATAVPEGFDASPGFASAFDAPAAADLPESTGEADEMPSAFSTEPMGAADAFAAPMESDAPPPLTELEPALAAGSMEEAEFGGDLPAPAEEQPIDEAPSGFSIPSTSEEGPFGFDDAFPGEEPKSTTEEKAPENPFTEEAGSDANEMASKSWGESPPLGGLESPMSSAPEEALEGDSDEDDFMQALSGPESPTPDAEKSGSGFATASPSALFGGDDDEKPAGPPAISEEAKEAPEAEPQLAVEKPADDPESAEDAVAEAISLPETGAAPTVTSQPLGGKTKRPRKGLVVFVVLLIGLTCGAALASFMLPVEDYVLRARAFMEETFDPAAVSNPVVPSELMTPATETTTPEAN